MQPHKREQTRKVSQQFSLRLSSDKTVAALIKFRDDLRPVQKCTGLFYFQKQNEWRNTHMDTKKYFAELPECLERMKSRQCLRKEIPSPFCLIPIPPAEQAQAEGYANSPVTWTARKPVIYTSKLHPRHHGKRIYDGDGKVTLARSSSSGRGIPAACGV